MRLPDPRRLSLALVHALALPLLSLGCGAAAPEPAHNLSDRTSALLGRAPAVYAPAAPAAPAGAAAPETEALRATFEAALEPDVKARLHHDPALDLVAAAVAENFSDQGKSPSRSLLEWMVWRSGSLATYHDRSGGWVGKPRANRASGGRQDTSALADWAMNAAKRANATAGSHLSYGLARFTEGRVTAEEIVFGWSYFEAASFSKTYAPGGPLTLALKPYTPYKELHFLIDKGDVVEDQTLAPREDGSFFLSQSVPTKPGRYFIEIQGPAPRRSTLLMLPLYVGVPEPVTPDAFIQSPPAGPADAAGWPALLASTYNAERAKLGKPPLEVDARLGTMAADRIAFLAGAAPPQEQTLAARLTAAGLSPANGYETVTTTQAADSVLLSLLRPSVRKRLVLADRVLWGAAASALPLVEKQPPSFRVVEETASAVAAPAPAVAPAPMAAPAPGPGR